MNTEDDRIISRLELSAGDVKRLSVEQIRSIQSLLQRCPPRLQEASRRLSHDDLIEKFRLQHIPIHAVEFPFSNLVRFLKELIPDWRMSFEEQSLLGSALSRYWFLTGFVSIYYLLTTLFLICIRNAATHIISVPVFIAIWKALGERTGENEESTPLQKAIERSKTIIELEFTSVHFIFGLIFHRLGHAFQIRCDQGSLAHLRWEDLKREMANVEIKLSEGTYQDFQIALSKSGLYSPPPENKVNIIMLLAVAKDHVDHVSNLTEEVNDRYECPISSTVARILSVLVPKWVQIRTDLIGRQKCMLATDKGVKLISESDFIDASRRTGGVIIAVADADHFWEYLIKKASQFSHQSFTGTGNGKACLSIEELDFCLVPREQGSSSLSSLMRGEYTYGHKTSHERSRLDHVSDIFNMGDQFENININANSDLSSPKAAHFPWQADEEGSVSNLRLRALSGLQQCSADQIQRFVNMLYENESTFNYAVARTVLMEAFSSVNIHFTSQDMHSLWVEIQSSVQSTKAIDILRWLKLDHVSKDRMCRYPSEHMKSSNRHQYSAGRIDAGNTQAPDPVHTAANPRHTQPRSTWDTPNLPEHQSMTSAVSNSTALADYAKKDVANDDWHARYDEPDINSVTENTETSEVAYKETLSKLLSDRAELAHVFRRISSGSGLGKGKDVCEALLRPPFSVPMSEQSMWKMVCQMAGVDQSASPARVYLRFNDVITYLENEAEMYLKPKEDPLKTSIISKLCSCKNIYGRKSEIIGQSHLLRTRLRHLRQRGSVTSWDAVPDVCYPQEFCQLMESHKLVSHPGRNYLHLSKH